MTKNRERLFLYLICLICFGVFVFVLNIEFIHNIIFMFKLKDTQVIVLSILIGVIFTLFYIIFLGMINSWILNIVYIYSYKNQGYNFLSYNLFPVIYIKNNIKKIRLVFNIILLYDIGSIVDISSKLDSESGLMDYIVETKKVYLNLVYTHYILILLGSIIMALNFALGGMIITYNIAIILFQSIDNSSFWGKGYICLSKKFNKYDVVCTSINFLKIINTKQDFIYNILQKEVINNNLNNIILNEFYQAIMINSINDKVDYLNIEIKNNIEKKFKQYSYFNPYKFLEHYRLYRLYCIYVLNFYGINEYKLLVKEIDRFYININSMAVVKNMKLFKRDRDTFKTCNFENLDLKNMFDICNSFDNYKEKLYKVVRQKL